MQTKSLTQMISDGPFLIGTDNIQEMLSTIVMDSIIIDNHFIIKGINQNVLDLLGYNRNELFEKDINCLVDDSCLVASLQKDLATGFSGEKRYVLRTKENAKIVACISGFYLGLISDINNKIILIVKKTEVVATIENPENTRIEIDQFIYRAAHDLRGPLATIKGLIDLIKIRENNDELDRLIQLVDSHANVLDERLFQLAYMAQYYKEENNANDEIIFHTIETRLRKIIEKNAFVDFLEFNFSSPKGTLSAVREDIISELLDNILLHTLSLPIKSIPSKINFKLTRSEKQLRITVITVGFKLTDEILIATRNPSFSYTDLVKYPQMVHYYGAKKLAKQLNTTIESVFIAEDKFRLEVRIPI
ncbi:MAG TPA: PAS domain-containing protein [Chryseolinea sp.]|nr:PAS domain-containing protein [Chryseolinea sp.]